MHIIIIIIIIIIAMLTDSANHRETVQIRRHEYEPPCPHPRSGNVFHRVGKTTISTTYISGIRLKDSAKPRSESRRRTCSARRPLITAITSATTILVLLLLRILLLLVLLLIRLLLSYY